MFHFFGTDFTDYAVIILVEATPLLKGLFELVPFKTRSLIGGVENIVKKETTKFQDKTSVSFFLARITRITRVLVFCCCTKIDGLVKSP